jgi:hypothetical protein
MKNPPRIWLDYRAVRIGWVIPNRDIVRLETMAMWNACLWGGRYNCVIPAHDTELAVQLVSCFAVDVLLPIQSDDATKTFIDRFPHLAHDRWTERIFHKHDCEFADIRHPLRRLAARQDRALEKELYLPTWDGNDPLAALFATQFGAYPPTTGEIADYKEGVRGVFGTPDTQFPANGELPIALLKGVSPLALTGFDMSLSRNRGGRLGPGIVLGSVKDFDTLAMFWNLRAAGARLIFYDETYGARLKAFANAFLETIRKPTLDRESEVNFWIRGDHSPDESWKPDLELRDTPVTLSDGRGASLWNGLNIQPQTRLFRSCIGRRPDLQ